MPVYEYKCNDCGHKFSLLRGINDTSKIICTSCSSENTEKMISLFSRKPSPGKGAGSSGCAPSGGG